MTTGSLLALDILNAVQFRLLLALFALPLLAFSLQNAAHEEDDDPAGRAAWFYSQRAFPFAKIPSGSRLRAIGQVRKLPLLRRSNAASMGTAWSSKGPAPIGTGAVVYSGRVAALAVDPRDKNVVYAGVSDGGVWKTTNGGQTWQPLTDDQPSLSIGSLALDPSNPDILYVGTGEENNSADSYYGAGILKLAGGVFTEIAGPFASPAGGAHIGALAVAPTNSNLILAGASGYAAGIFRSQDGGVTWTNPLPGAAGSDVLFEPGNSNVVYAALGTNGANSQNGVYKSTDAGSTWTRLTGAGGNLLPTENLGRVSLAVSKTNPQFLLASIANAVDGSLLGLYQTKDGGANWTQLSRAPGFCANICWYANVVAIHPLNPAILYAGGGSNGMYVSINGGVTWQSVGAGVVHVDHHAFAFSGDGTRLYNGNDGGVWSTDQTAGIPTYWNNLNNTLSTALLNHGFSQSPHDATSIYAGTQDNQVLRYAGTSAWQVISPCGDGGQVVLDPAIPDLPIANCAKLQIFKALDVSKSIWIGAIHGIDPAETVQFYPPLVGDPTHGQRLYFGAQHVYQSIDGGGLWRAISPNLTLPAINASVTAITVAPSDPNRVYAATSTGNLWVTSNALSGPQAAWTLTKSPLPLRFMTHIAVSQTDPDVAYVAYSGFGSGHVYKTADGGQTFDNVSNSLPDVPVNEIALDPDLPGSIYLATDLGVLASADDGQTWNRMGGGLPNVVVISLALHRNARMLRAATHGRGMWELPVPLPAPSLAPTITWLDPSSGVVTGAPQGITVRGTSFTSETQILWNGMPRPTVFVSGTELNVTPTADDLSAPGRATLIAANPPAAGGLSAAVNLDIGPAPSLASLPTLTAGGLFTIYGANLASGTAQAAAGTQPLTLAGALVKVGGVVAALSYASPGQINVQAPWGLAGTRTTVEVVVGNFSSGPVPANAALAAPLIYTLNAAGQGAIVDAVTGAIAAAAGTFPGARPVAAGGYISVYCTGLGPVDAPESSGVPASLTMTASIYAPVTVAMAGVNAKVLFAGLAPGFVGLYQVNAQVPSSGVGPSPAVPLSLTINGTGSNTVTFALQ